MRRPTVGEARSPRDSTAGQAARAGRAENELIAASSRGACSGVKPHDARISVSLKIAAEERFSHGSGRFPRRTADQEKEGPDTYARGLAILLVIALFAAVAVKGGTLVKDRLALERIRTVDTPFTMSLPTRTRCCSTGPAP